jgi:hypothetical protein
MAAAHEMAAISVALKMAGVSRKYQTKYQNNGISKISGSYNRNENANENEMAWRKWRIAAKA